jgi:hypothetical protein
VTLEERILAAWEGGNLALLKELQAEYRRGVVCSSDRGPTLPMRLVEKTTPATATKVSKPRSSWRLPRKAHSAGTAAYPAGIEIAPSAREAITDFCFDARASIIEGFEPGGLLYGEVERVLYASTCGEPGERFCRLDFGNARDEEKRLGARVIGDWHAHCGVGEPVPSRADLAGWRDAARLSGRTHIGLMLFSPDTSWIEPELRAWVTRSASRGRYLTDPVEITTA